MTLRDQLAERPGRRSRTLAWLMLTMTIATGRILRSPSRPPRSAWPRRVA